MNIDPVYALMRVNPVGDLERYLKKLSREFVIDYRFAWHGQNYTDVIGAIITHGIPVILGLFLILFFVKLVIEFDFISLRRTVLNIFSIKKFISYKMEQDKSDEAEEKDK